MFLPIPSSPVVELDFPIIYQVREVEKWRDDYEKAVEESARRRSLKNYGEWDVGHSLSAFLLILDYRKCLNSKRNHVVSLRIVFD